MASVAPLALPEPGSAGKTGVWRFERPVIDYGKCTKCGLCWLYCPDAVFDIRPDGYPEVRYDYCKGCGICANECPVDAITMVRE